MTLPKPTAQAPRRLPPLPAFVNAAVGFTALFVAAGATTPLLVNFQHSWRFAPWLLTLAFAIYAFGLIAALLTVGALSDRVGRRPVLLGALATQLLVTAMFAGAPNITVLIAARALQGVTTGAATGAFTAFIAELAPPRLKALGAVLASVIPAGGLALGVALTGVAVQVAPHPNAWVYAALGAVTAVVLIGLLRTHETVLGPHGAAPTADALRLGTSVRREFRAAVPVHLSAWMVAGLFLGLGPSILRDPLHLTGGALVGLIVALEPGSAVVVALLGAQFTGRVMTRFGGAALLAGTLVVVLGLWTSQWPWFVAGGVLSGAGFGWSFSGALRTLSPLVPPDRRAAVFASVYVVAYLAFGLPVLIAGTLIAPLGLRVTVTVYALVTAAVTLAGLLTQWRQERLAERVSATRPLPTGGLPASPPSGERHE